MFFRNLLTVETISDFDILQSGSTISFKKLSEPLSVGSFVVRRTNVASSWEIESRLIMEFRLLCHH